MPAFSAELSNVGGVRKAPVVCLRSEEKRTRKAKQRKRPVPTVLYYQPSQARSSPEDRSMEGMADSARVMKDGGRKRQRRSIAEKRRIVGLAVLPRASVAGGAREHEVNAHMVHYWRNLYRQGRLCFCMHRYARNHSGHDLGEFPKVHLCIES